MRIEYNLPIGAGNLCSEYFFAYCEDKFALEKPQISRLMNIVDEFGNKARGFKVQWKDFKYSQLCELLPLTEEQRMMFSAKALAIAQANGQTVDVKIKATVIHDDASNKAVDFSVEWGYATVHKDEAVTDFITVTQDYDGSVNATVSCKKAFDTDKIIVKVTTREGGFTAKCTVTFLGVATSMNISSTEVTPVSSSERGVYYQLGTKKTYTFNIALDNDFGKVGSKNLTATIGAVGNLYFGDMYVNSDSGLGTFSNMKSKPLSTYADRFITSATISENILTVTVGAICSNRSTRIRKATSMAVRLTTTGLCLRTNTGLRAVTDTSLTRKQIPKQ